LEKFRKMPLLGCYVLHEFKPAVLMGLFDAFDYDDIPGQVQEEVVGRLSVRDQWAINFYVTNIEPLRKGAFAKINTAPYAFEEEIQRRRERSYAGAGKDASPEFIQNMLDKSKESEKWAKGQYYAKLRAPQPPVELPPAPPGIGDAGKGYQGKGQGRVRKTVSPNKMRRRIKKLEASKLHMEKTRAMVGPGDEQRHIEAIAKYVLDRQDFIKMRNRYNAQAPRRSSQGFDRAAKAYVAQRKQAKMNAMSGDDK
jgi:hypothetical protein